MYYAKGLRLIVIFFIAPFILVSACTDSKSDVKDKDITSSQKIVQSFIEESCKRPATLISIKYSINEDIVYKIIVSESLVDSKELFAKSPSEFRNRIFDYSKHYKISPKMVANILIDYEFMKSKE